MVETFYINDQLIDQPDGWRDFEYKVRRDDSIRFIGISTPLEVTFRGSGYDVLNELARVNGRAYVAAFSIRDASGQTIYTGLINLTEGENNIEQQSWRTKVRDGNFSSYIYAHRELKVNTSLNRTRDAETPITPLSPFNLTFPAVGRTTFVTQSQFDHGVVFQARDLHDVMTYLVEYISNGVLSFQSDWYDSLPSDEKICLVDGREMTMLSNDPLIVSIQDIMDSVGRLYNLYLSASGSTIRLEPESYFFNTTNSIDVTDVRQSIVRFDELSLLREIKIGDGYVTQNMTWLPQKDEHFAPRDCFMDVDAISDATIDLQPVLVANGGAIIAAFHESIAAITQFAREYAQRLGNRPLELIYESGFATAGSFAEWMVDKVGLVQYTTTTNTVTTEVDGAFTYCNMQFRNTNVLARYNFGGNIYAQAREFNSFRMMMEQGYVMGAFTNQETTIDFDDTQTQSPQIDIEGGEYNGSSPVYSPIFVNEYVAPAAETKSFTLGVLVPQYVGGGTEADIYNPHPFGVDVISIDSSKTNITINAVAKSGITTILALSEPSNWELGDFVTLDFQTGNWTAANGVYEITSIDASTQIVTVDLNASITGFDLAVTDFFNGTASADSNAGRESLTSFNIILRIRHYNAQRTLLNTHTETITSAQLGRPYTTTASFDLGTNHIVSCSVEFDGSTVDNPLMFLPVVWRDNSASARELITVSAAGFRGLKLECETVLSLDQIDAVLENPDLAVQLPDGKGWIETMDVNRITGHARITLLTNQTFYNGIN